MDANESHSADCPSSAVAEPLVAFERAGEEMGAGIRRQLLVSCFAGGLEKKKKTCFKPTEDTHSFLFKGEKITQHKESERERKRRREGWMVGLTEGWSVSHLRAQRREEPFWSSC